MTPSQLKPAPEAGPALAGISLFLPSSADTRAAGLALGRSLPHDAIVLLRGDLGSGKTTLIKAICESLGIVPAVVISPTYTLVNIYPGSPTVYHVDLYRLERADALTELDEGDWLNPGGPTFIEWPELAAPMLAGRATLSILLEHEGTGRRMTASTGIPDLIPAIEALKDFASRAHR